jgi:hypothetical protein
MPPMHMPSPLAAATARSKSSISTLQRFPPRPPESFSFVDETNKNMYKIHQSQDAVESPLYEPPRPPPALAPL